MVLASLLTLGAFWQAQIAITRDASARHQSLPAPMKTRHAVRPAETSWSGDVVADYIARCGKGMTDQEIRWIVEDFHNAGLDQIDFTDKTPDAELSAYLAAQYHWYYSALVDGLRLDPKQAADCAANLKRMAQASVADFVKNRESSNPDCLIGYSNPFANPIPLALTLAHGGNDPDMDPFMPWKLCNLNHEQERLTWKGWYDSFCDFFRQPRKTFDMEAISSEVKSIGVKLSESKDGPPFLFPDPQMSESPAHLASPPWTGGGWTCGENWVFPLLSNQKDVYRTKQKESANRSRQDDFREFLEPFHHLHPGQFKIILIFDPELAEMIQTALDELSH